MKQQLYYSNPFCEIMRLNNYKKTGIIIDISEIFFVFNLIEY